MARKGLGRGLETILGDERQESTGPGEGGVALIPVTDIAPDPYQPRKRFDDEALEELAASIRTRGVLQPILVRPTPGEKGYTLIAGERRWRAAGRAGLHEIPALIREPAEGDVAEMALIENVQRQDLNPIEEADAYARLRDSYGRTAKDIAESIGKSRPHVANMLRLTGLPDDIKGLVSAGELTMGHARALLSAAAPAELAKQIIEEGLSVREAERRAAGKTASGASSHAQRGEGENGKKAAKASGRKDADTRSLEEDLAATLGLEVSIDHHGKGGTLTVSYGDLDQLDDLCRRLTGSRV
ncbi:ParB-like partition protein [Parvularcula bermudensis HTCC2503]|uniref:ParB-like partition protein n=1 Tax=Parvularcula bermudensis (strain ATCC BAA-594 / HTCC2503 / KCTC 12087) TaxID=314260 RepID=E0TET1_PARBH|nr:ParB/RepB/Spo0J family partition protein [Parvularcula bermudensis]ADM08964.1 ParB-like partition protein [Parvularcula bermudensis HTCC2503]